MLAYLLDEHLSPKIADRVATRRQDIPAVSIRHWHDGMWMRRSDEVVLATGRAESLTLVTYDQRTIVPLLVRCGMAGVPHSGVVFVDDRTIAPNDIGALVQALIALWDVDGATDWTNRAAYLRRAT